VTEPRTALAVDRGAGEDLPRAVATGFGALFFAPTPGAGALLLASTFLSSPIAGTAVLIGILSSTVMASVLRRPRVEIAAGLHGFNGALTGFALLAMSGLGDRLFFYLVPAAAATTIAMAAFLDGCWVRRWSLPALSVPSLLVAYPLIRWVLPSAAAVEPEALLPAFLTPSDLFRPEYHAPEMREALSALAIDWPAKVLFLLGLWVHSWRLLALALSGVLAGALVGWTFLGWVGALNATFVLYCAAPVFVGLAGAFTSGGPKSWAYGVAGVVAAFFAWFHLGFLLGDAGPRGLPLLTLPCAATLLGMLAILRVAPDAAGAVLPKLVPLAHAGSPESSRVFASEQKAGLEYWREIAALDQRPAKDGARPAQMRRAQDLVRRSHRIVVLTGAGISTDSGIPDYRTGAIAWKRYDTSHFRWENFIASEESRRKYWEMSQDFYLLLRTARPNAGHRAIATLAKRGKLLAIVTQNVDWLHQRAGVDPARVIELHGNEHHVSCLQCGRAYSRDDVHRWILNGVRVPHCAACQGILKPDSVAFGQPMPEEVSRRALEAVRNCDLLVVAGTSLTVQPAATLPLVALRAGARVVIANLHPTDYDPFADVVLRGPLSSLLPRLAGAE
jgi:NAD-dependent deacetylase